jgi:hypothetical protein
MSSCSKCWLEPCECGYMYEHMTPAQIQAQITILEKLLRDKLVADFRKNNAQDSCDGPEWGR